MRNWGSRCPEFSLSRIHPDTRVHPLCFGWLALYLTLEKVSRGSRARVVLIKLGRWIAPEIVFCTTSPTACRRLKRRVVSLYRRSFSCSNHFIEQTSRRRPVITARLSSPAFRRETDSYKRVLTCNVIRFCLNYALEFSGWLEFPSGMNPQTRREAEDVTLLNIDVFSGWDAGGERG